MGWPRISIFSIEITEMGRRMQLFDWGVKALNTSEDWRYRDPKMVITN